MGKTGPVLLPHLTNIVPETAKGRVACSRLYSEWQSYSSARLLVPRLVSDCTS